VLAALGCCLLVAASFALFTTDQLAGASRHQVGELAGTAPQPATLPTAGSAPARPLGQPRRFIDSAAEKLTAPFAGLVPSDNPWVAHGVPTLVALLVYGVGLGYLARYSSGFS